MRRTEIVWRIELIEPSYTAASFRKMLGCCAPHGAESNDDYVHCGLPVPRARPESILSARRWKRLRIMRTLLRTNLR